MKIRIDVDVSPAEARAFLGLPDVEPIQREMLETLRARIESGAEDFDAAAMMRPFLTPNLQTMETMQKAFWQAVSGAAARRERDGDDD